MIQDSKIEENNATYGGGIFNFPNSSIVMTRTVISANIAQYGGGIYNQLATLMMSDSMLLGNNAVRFGGGIDNRGGALSDQFVRRPQTDLPGSLQASRKVNIWKLFVQ